MKEIDFKWPLGFKSDGLHIGLRKEKLDFGWIVSDVPANAAGVYTTNKFCAAPTALTKASINQGHQLQAIVMNSAIANSCTGQQGQTDAQAEQKLVADKLSIDPSLVGVASTGLIGAFLPMDKIEAGIQALEPNNNFKVTEAVLTTDTHPKTISLEFEIGGQTCTMSGLCKGSGMIHPNMATMLGFITTDATIDGDLLQTILSEEVDVTFNQITVDGDTSTNDMVVVMANGQAQATAIRADSEAYQTFKAALKQAMTYLAQQIAKDGEGATKLVEANVTQAPTALDAQKIAKAVVGSNLVKAALFGEDANWGRIISTIGITDADFDPATIDIALNGHPVVQQSLGLDFDEETLKTALQADKIVIEINLNDGEATGQAWGCDLTYQYVQINASYRS